MRSLALILALAVATLLAPTAAAVHFYRGTGGGCSAADGELTDDALPSGPVGATVMMLHNSYADASTGLPVTFVGVGGSVRWVWSSLHCHSATAAAFNSGFHYPIEAGAIRAVPGFFDHPLPSTDPQLAYTHTFLSPGTYVYGCVHHASIGMRGVVVVG